MSDDWFAFRLAPDGDVEDGCHPEEAQAIKDYLRRRTTAVEAARAITHPIVTTDTPREDLARLWGFLQDAFVQLPAEYIEPLMALIHAIECLPEPDFSAVEERNRPYDKLWSGLGSFGHLWADIYQSGCWKSNAEVTKGLERDELRDKHVRMAEIEARMVTARLGRIPIDWGYETVVNALESSNALLDFEVPAAAQWIVICGERFRQGAEKGEKSWALKPRIPKPSDVASRDSRRAPLDQVMSLERWSLWEERLRELQAEPGAVGDAATMALGAMREGNSAPL
jgi:hypothetical protein